MTKVVEIAPNCARRVLDHALDVAPDECCGILMGPTASRITKVIPTNNVHENPRTEYEIDPEALYEATEEAEEGPLELVGFYHSHPRGRAAFSDTDVDRGSWEDKVYLLASLAPLAFLARVWNGQTFDEVEVHVDPSG